LPRVDDYAAAFDLAARALKAKDPVQAAALAEADFQDGALGLRFLDQEVRVDLDPVQVRRIDGREIPLTDQVLVLHYLSQADGRPLAGEWIAYRDIPGAEVYHPVFYQRAVAPLLKAFGPRPELLEELAAVYPISPGQAGDVSVVVQAFARVPLELIIWAGDDEFPAEANILLDRSVSGYLTAEDVAWVAGRVVYPLAGAARAKGVKA